MVPAAKLFLLYLSALAVVGDAGDATISRREPPAVTDWPHRPVMLQSNDDDMALEGENSALPLGVPFEFETPLFKGKFLLRLRNAKSDDPESHESYFKGRKKRLMQTVIQGQFKKPVKMSDVFVGSILQEPLKNAPPPYFMRIMNTVIKKLSPGVVMDFDSKSPRIMALYAGSAKSMSIDLPGQEPEITGSDILENVSRKFGNKFKNVKDRQSKLSSPQKASMYEFDTDHVYTFHTYDEAMDYGNYSMRIPMMGDYDISKALGQQPLSISAVTKSGETVFSFNVWHESILQKKRA